MESETQIVVNKPLKTQHTFLNEKYRNINEGWQMSPLKGESFEIPRKHQSWKDIYNDIVEVE